MGKIIDLTGQKFGKLIVLEIDLEHPKTKNRSTFWKCQCECGNIVSICGNNLRSGNTKSCGCITKVGNHFLKTSGCFSRVDLTNKRFGHLVALESTNKKDKWNQVIWKCQCDCGNIIEVDTHTLQQHKKLSCGCAKSKGENKIYNILLKNNINFKTQYTFANCRYVSTNQLARFDFYLPDYNAIIEYNGIQHYQQNNFFSQSLQEIQDRDRFKQEWCLNHQIKFIQIPYWDLEKIDLNYIKNLL